ncbi:MAG: Phage protein gp10 family [Devosia sp.]|uniref:HK97 gp10 family phage protein n=1 Tax=Devosia sp. TaxID=1871048 RepID=UPI002611AD76|nr:HK97 gp10 family phage protein [Devosia sp.]MDB5541395.1 Phage protein gp10 family [Devosia sp.]
MPNVLKVQGLEALNRKLARMPAAAKTQIRAALDSSADEMVSMARTLAPVLEGDLKNSIEKIDGSHELQILVRAGGGAAGLAYIAEYGHGKAAPRPFFWPAYRSLRKRIRSRLTRAINKAAKGAAK